jgi:molybdopterin synthase catalytic subunit
MADKPMVILSHEPIHSQIFDTSLPAAHGCSISFVGVVRDNNEGQAVQWVQYTAHQSLAVLTLEKIIQEAKEQWGEQINCAIAHRLGQLLVGDISVVISVSSAHRDESYQVSRFLIEQLKLRVPIWKKESYQSGECSWLPGQPLLMSAHSN